MFSNHCAKCGYIRMPMEGTGEACPRCGTPYVASSVEVARSVDMPRLIHDPIEQAWASRDFSRLTTEQVAVAANRIMLSTTESIAAKPSSATLGLVSGTYTFAFGAVSEAIGGLARNLAGSGPSFQTQEHLRVGMREVSQTMQRRALALAADAVVGVRFSFEEFSGANNLGGIVVVGTGTAVRH